MRRAVLELPRKIKHEEYTLINQLKDYEVMIDIKKVTLCGSDIRYFKEEKLPYDLKHPIILGHESSGIVTGIGEKVTKVNVGDKVAIEPGLWCGKCRYCKQSRYNFCLEMKFMASHGYPGALQEKVIWNEKCVWKLPDEFNLETGALIEPLSVAYDIVNKIKNEHSIESISVLGAGPIGVFTVKLINHFYPKAKVKLIDMISEKSILIKELKLKNTEFIHSKENLELDNIDVLIDTTGSHILIEEVAKFLSKEGIIVLSGISDESLKYNLKQIIYNGTKVIGSYRYRFTYLKLIEYLEKNFKEINKIIQEEYAFDQAQIAFEKAASQTVNGKVLISVNE